MTIKRDSIWTNPYRDHPRMNGTRHAQSWRDLQDDDLGVWRGFANALILGLCAWGLLAVVVMLVLEAMA